MNHNESGLNLKVLNMRKPGALIVLFLLTVFGSSLLIDRFCEPMAYSDLLDIIHGNSAAQMKTSEIAAVSFTNCDDLVHVTFKSSAAVKIIIIPSGKKEDLIDDLNRSNIPIRLSYQHSKSLVEQLNSCMFAR